MEIGHRRAVQALIAAAGLGLLGLAVAPKPWSLPTGPGFAQTPGRSFALTVQIALTWAIAVNVWLALGLAATARWWARPLQAGLPPAPARRIPRRILLGLLAAAALAGALRWPLMGGSLWWDEAWSIRHAIVGRVDPAPEDPGQLVHQPVSWARTLWYYHKPTNHVPYSVVARMAIEVERAWSGRPAWQFSERAFHLPAWLASIGSVLLLGGFLARLGLPAPAVAAAFLLAIHPWHIRYGAEGRGYSLLLPAAIAAAWALTRALEDPRWRPWLGYGACLGLFLWIHPVAVYPALTLTGAGCSAIALSRRSRADRLTIGMRLVVVNVLAAMAYLLLTAPHVSQALAWTDVVQIRDTLTPEVLRETWAGISVGVPEQLSAESPHHDVFASLGLWRETAPALGGLVYGLLPLLALGGLVGMARRAPAGLPAVLGLVSAVLLLLLLSELNQMYYYARFAIYEVAMACLLFAVGVEQGLRALPIASARKPALVSAGLVAGLVGFQLLVAPQTRILLGRPYAPSGEVAAFLARGTADDPNSVLRAAYGLGCRPLQAYDPWIRSADGPEELAALEAEALRSERPLRVALGYPGQNRRKRPAGVARLEDPARYARVAAFQGIEPQFTYVVYRFRGLEAER